jgi:hypothetical protein|tara:strand:- start:36 stop:428 length:393 start_codon:yes stop_codon:yes gene_type:complete
MSKQNFRYLIIADIIIFILFFVKIFFLEPNFSSEALQYYFDNEFYSSTQQSIFSMSTFLLSFIFEIMMFFFIRYSRQLWLFIFIISFIDLDFAPLLLGYIEYLIITILIMIQSIMIYAMFFTSLKDEFEK